MLAYTSIYISLYRFTIVQQILKGVNRNLPLDHIEQTNFLQSKNYTTGTMEVFYENNLRLPEAAFTYYVIIATFVYDGRDVNSSSLVPTTIHISQW